MTRILVVDDDATTVEVVCAVLELYGYSCVRASDGIEALDVVRTTPGVQIAISDISMPGIDGLSFLQQLNAMAAPAPRVIFLTAHPNVEHAVAALRLGAIDFLIKPMRAQSLLEVVRKAVANVQQERAGSDLPTRRGTFAQRAEQPVRSAERAADAGPARHRLGAVHPQDMALKTLEDLRRLRRLFISKANLDCVGWELLTELLRAERNAQRLSVSALSGTLQDVSSTTALRRIHELVKVGHIVRIPDRSDARRDFVALTPEIRSTLEEYLERLGEELSESVSAH
jgi:CheY-like chemotaxis protein/DNA-binding MarR family transcriptional regulator